MHCFHDTTGDVTDCRGRRFLLYCFKAQYSCKEGSESEAELSTVVRMVLNLKLRMNFTQFGEQILHEYCIERKY